MGLYHKGIPETLALKIARDHNINYFVETGTQVGRTAAWAASHFRVVVTIEVDREYYIGSIQKYWHLNNVRFVFGNSAEKLLEIAPFIKEPAMFWLDAHWSRDLSYPQPEIICPVMAEIEAINHGEDPGHVIMIDDARLFVGGNWPEIGEVIRALQEGHNRHVIIKEDVIFAWKKGTADV